MRRVVATVLATAAMASTMMFATAQSASARGGGGQNVCAICWGQKPPPIKK